MRTSLNDIQSIERHLTGIMSSEEAPRFRKRMEGDALFKTNIFLQRQIMLLLRYYHRRMRKKKLHALHHQLHADPIHADFTSFIHSIFKH